jgi:hypothetical protein
MAPSIRFRCPNCSAHIKAPMQVIGRTHTCPQCRQPMNIELLVHMGTRQDCGPVLCPYEPPRSVAIEQDSKGPPQLAAAAR